MPTGDNSIYVEHGLYADGYLFEPGIDAHSYTGVVSNSFDVNLSAEQTDKEVDLSDWGTIKRIYLIAKSGEIYFKLDNTEERTPIESMAILSYQPTKLELDNDHETSTGLVEVTIIGETA